MIYRFGEFELDDAQLELRFRGAAQVVPPRVLRAIVHLLRNRERAVSRDELVDVVWGGLVVSDAALSQTIMLARKVTRDEADHPTVIKTVRGHGFRFVAQVSECERRAALSVAPAPLASDVPDALVGRDREHALLVSQLSLAERGRGSLVLLEGAPGIGKTSLVEAFVARAEARGAHVFWGRCWEDGGAPAFWPFIQLLRAICERYGVEVVRSWLDDGCRDLLYLVPELLPPGAAEPSATDLDAPQAQFRVFDALGRVLRRMAHALHREAAQPPLAAPAVVAVLDDLHAADDASVHFLRFLSFDLRDTPLLVIGTFRDLALVQPGALSALVGGPLEHTQRIALSGLLLPDVARLAERLLGRAVAARTAAQLQELSSGNPFLVGELTRFSQGEAELSALAILRVPERMAKAVRRRLEGLSAETRTLLELAAVLGVEFPLEHLRCAAARSTDALLRDLEPALRTGTLEPVLGSAGARLRFVHALVRDTLYGDLPLVRRMSLHQTVAEALEARAGASELPLYELAHHYYLAAPAGVAQKAVEYTLKAAEKAAAVMAFDTAGSLRDRALELLRESHDSPARRWELLIGAGHTWFSAGELDKAIERYRAAAELARDQLDANRFAAAVLLCIRVRRGFTLFDPALTSLIAAAIDMQGPDDAIPKALLLGLRGVSAHSMGDVTERDALTRESVTMARRLGEEITLARALMIRAWLMTGVLPPDQTRETTNEAVAVARSCGNVESLLDTLYWRMHYHFVLGDVAQADHDLAEYTALGEREHNVLHRYWAATLHAMRSAWTGDFATAAQLSAAALTRGQRIQEPLAADVHAIQHWNAAVLQGNAVDSVAIVSHQGTHAGRTFELSMCLTAGLREQAQRLYDELARNDFADIPAGPHRLTVLSLLSNSCAQLDDRMRARHLYDLLASEAGLHVFPLGSLAYVGPVAEFLGQLANCLGDRALAASHFECALEQVAGFRARPHLARIQYQYAHTLRATPGASPELAAELLRQVAEAADELGTARRWPLPLGVSVDHADER